MLLSLCSLMLAMSASPTTSLKHIGIVACSAEGAAQCYTTICQHSEKRLGRYQHPQVSMHTHSLADYVDCLQRDDIQGIGELMLSSAAKLKAAGADFLICPDNTVHQALPFIENQSPLPWIHIADAVVQSAFQHRYQQLGILGTQWLVESQVYTDKIKDAGLNWIRPDQEERQEISRIIMEELVYGTINSASRQYYQKVIQKLKTLGCDAVILGCTEIPLLISNEDSVLPTLNSNELLAFAAIDSAVTEHS